MKTTKYVYVTKNRGWRGLAEARCTNEKGELTGDFTFSFSSSTWNDLMINNTIVVQDTKGLYIIKIKDTEGKLPVGHQRSVLLKNIRLEVEEIIEYPSDKPTKIAYDHYYLVRNFRLNKNNHTTSDWNCIGIRVMPSI